MEPDEEVEEVEKEVTTGEAASEEPGTEAEKSEGSPEDNTPPAGKEPAWAKKRIGELTKEKWDARREAIAAQARADEAERRLAEATKMKPPEKKGEEDLTKNFSQEELERLAEEKASAKVEIDKFNDKCNSVFTKGQETYSDFVEILGNFRDVGGLNADFLQAVLETDEPHKILYELGKDRDEAHRLITLPPLKRAIALGKIAVKLSEPKEKPVSKAPPPISGVRKGGGVRAAPNPEEMTMAEWIKWRETELAKK